MGRDQRSVRMLLIAVFVPVLILVGVLATAVLGNGGADGPGPAMQTITVAPPAAQPVVPVAPPAPVASPPVATPPPAVAPAPPAAQLAPIPAPPSTPTLPVAPPPAAPAVAPPAPVPEPPPGAGPSPRYVPAGAERVDVGSGAQGAAIFQAPGNAGTPGPVVIFLHGWVAIDPQRYGPWIGHLVRSGTTVIFPAYQSKPAFDTITPIANVLAGVRTALEQVHVADGRLVVAGHSAGGALAADYAALATANGLPAPAAVFSVYPGRKLRHLAIAIPQANLEAIAPGTRVLALAGERDTAVGSGPARLIAVAASRADAALQIITDDAVDDHSAPRRFDGAAQRTFWKPLDELVAATAPDARGEPER